MVYFKFKTTCIYVVPATAHVLFLKLPVGVNKIEMGVYEGALSEWQFSSPQNIILDIF